MKHCLTLLLLLGLATAMPLADALAQAGRGAVSGAIIGGAVGDRRGAAIGPPLELSPGPVGTTRTIITGGMDSAGIAPGAGGLIPSPIDTAADKSVVTDLPPR